MLGTLCQPWNLTIFKALIWLIPGKNFTRYLILTTFCLLYADIPSFLGWKLHSAGEEVWEIFDSLPETETGEDFVTAVNALKTYFQPKQNKCLEHHIFCCCAQQEAESIGSYVSRLRTLARTCKFHSVDEELIAQTIEK